MEKAVSTQRGSICLRGNTARTTIFVLVPKELMVVHLKYSNIVQVKTVCTSTLNVTPYISARTIHGRITSYSMPYHGMVTTSYFKPSCFQNKMALPSGTLESGKLLHHLLPLKYSEETFYTASEQCTTRLCRGWSDTGNLPFSFFCFSFVVNAQKMSLCSSQE